MWLCVLRSTSQVPVRGIPAPIRRVGLLGRFACVDQSEASRMEAVIKKLSASSKRKLVGRSGAAARKILFG